MILREGAAMEEKDYTELIEAFHKTWELFHP